MISKHFSRLLTLVVVLLISGCGTPAVVMLPPSTQITKPDATATPVPRVATSTAVPTSTTVPPSATVDMTGMDMSGMAIVSGDAARGKLLFAQGIRKSDVPTCASCHYDDKDEVKVGPALSDIGTHGVMHAAELGQDVVTFLRTSIINPNANLMTDPTHIFAVNGVSLMYQDYGKDLTEQQTNDLVAYLLTLK